MNHREKETVSVFVSSSEMHCVVFVTFTSVILFCFLFFPKEILSQIPTHFHSHEGTTMSMPNIL